MLVGHGREELCQRSAIGQFGVGPGLQQRLEDEAALREPGMGNRKSLPGDLTIAEEQYVEVEGARSPAFPAFPPVPAFDRQTRFEEVGGCQVGVDNGDRVEERTLGGAAHRRSLVQGGDGNELTKLAQRTDSLGDVTRSITQVRAEADGGPHQRRYFRAVGSGISRRPSGPRGRPAISWMTEVATMRFSMRLAWTR